MKIELLHHPCAQSRRARRLGIARNTCIAIVLLCVLGTALVGCRSTSPPSDGSPGQSIPAEPRDILVEGNGQVEQQIDGDTITLTATPQEGWRFDTWLGTLNSTQNPVTITASESDAIGVRFVEDDTPGGGGDDPDVGADLPVDADGDGVSDENDLCADTSTNALVDGDGCAQAQRDDDGDGVPNAEDQCAGFPDEVDSDGDGVADGCDACIDGDDAVDSDGDGVADACDPCPADNPDDTDGDGICDTGDVCPGFDDAVDSDNDGIPNGCDECSAGDDATDTDADGIPNACDPCPLDNPDDSDGDGVCDSDDACEGFDDADDADADGVPDECDETPNGDVIDTDGDGVSDEIDQCSNSPPGEPVDGVGCPILSVCGNGILETGEACDPPCNTCSSSCDTVSSGTATWAPAFDTSSTGALSGVWGSGPSDVFIVGGTTAQGEVYHFDGNDWTAMDIPPVSLLIWVFGFSSDNVYAVGLGGGVIHYNGISWSVIDSGTDVDLWGIWGSSPSNMWVVGGSAFTGEPFLARFDGTTLTPVALPAHDRVDVHALFKVWGIGSKVFAVGQKGLLIEHNGVSWSQVESGVSDDLIALWGSGEENIVAVGGRAFGQIVRYDGQTWTATLPAGVPGLNAIFVGHSSEAVIGGVNGYAASLNPQTSSIEFESTGTLQTIHAGWTDCNGTYYAVGGLFNFPFTGIALVRTLTP